MFSPIVRFLLIPDKGLITVKILTPICSETVWKVEMSFICTRCSKKITSKNSWKRNAQKSKIGKTKSTSDQELKYSLNVQKKSVEFELFNW